MKDYIKDIYNEAEHDGFMFILDEKDKLDISAFTYKEPSKPIESNSIGYKYHIITYKETLDGDVIEPDMFEAILGDPYHYIGNLLECGFFGTICKKTKDSFKIVEEIYSGLLEVAVEDEEYA